jgi:Cys-rich four helix bundle protein (predicted Tat secretion target)
MPQPEVDVSKRNLMTAGAGIALGLAAGAALAADKDEHAGHAGHGEHRHHDAPRKNIVAAAMRCQETGVLCINHCLVEFKAGNTELADCARSISDMQAVCAGLAQLAGSNSPHFAAYAKVCLDVCDTCEKECRKHEKKHAICKDSGDACAALVKELRGIV